MVELSLCMRTAAMSDITNQLAGGAAPSLDNAAMADGIKKSFAAIALLFAAAMLCIAAPSLLNDPDTLWHTKVGHDIWATGAFPTVDSYTHTFTGEPWIAKQWLSGVLMAGAFALGGWNGVVALAILALLAAFVIVHRQLQRHLAPGAALLIGLWVFAMSSSAFLARPHALALPVALWFIIHVWNAADDRRAPRFYALIALALWANLHGSFTLGMVAAGFAFLHFAFSERVWTKPGFWKPATIWQNKTQRQWLIFLALCPVAACVHPYGWHSIASTLFIADNALLDHVHEWRAFTFGEEPLISAHLLLGAVLLLATPLRASFAKAAFIAFVVYLYLSHVRFVFLLFLVPAALMAREMAQAFPRLSLSQWRERAQWDGLEQAAGRWSTAVIAVIAGLGATLFALTVLLAPLQPPATNHPVKALDAVRDTGITGPVMNSYGFGGALIFEGIPTFVDGRADRLFDNGAFIATYFDAAGDAEAVTAYLTDHAIGWTLLNPRDPNVAVMDALDGWQRLHADENAIVHVPAGG